LEIHDQPEVFRPEPPGIRGTLSLARDTRRLAGHAPSDEVDPPTSGHNVICRNGSDIHPPRHIRPVLLEDSGAIGIEFDLAGNGQAGGLETQIVGTYSAE